MVTRDTNIIVMTGNNNGYLANTKPLTLTSINNGNDYRDSATYTISNSSIRAGNDLCIQYLNMTTSTNLATGEATITTNALSNEYIYGNWNNLKLVVELLIQLIIGQLLLELFPVIHLTQVVVEV